MKRFLFIFCFLFSNISFGQKILGEFVAMEYRGISNLIYKVIISDSSIGGLKTSGYIAVENPFGIGYSVPRDELDDPRAYMDRDLVIKYKGINTLSDTILKIDKNNFIIYKKDINRVYHTNDEKWGMGYYPYTGRIIIETIKTIKNKRSHRDLILVGKQDQKRILELINN